ncbi:MAG: bifunctional phosphopantothenoylcysteine decarboxylase/phosphopantothenate--cysteine ligase CoaBC [Syntrophales bacterium]|nr:bifunctional phosphopantothenoylcysteine decarboxylase/phosphopantothenate--cysteine ligase CoaBC [Syntrophales bacterium]
MLKEKNIVLGISGGIAAYKAAELTREMVKKEAQVRVIMTKKAMEFVTPLTFQVLSSHTVFTDMFNQDIYDINHISLAESADILVIAPATANIIGKIASGIADDLLTTVVMATHAPVLICPAMNVNMYTNVILQENIARLKDKGYNFVAPGYGELACKTEGIGRLADLSDIMASVESMLTVKDLCGEKIIVTAGPTREPFDPVRFITNYSSGKMGYALATMASRRGADVTLISGPSSLPIPKGMAFIPVSSAQQMRDAVMEQLEGATVVIKAAAVADYRPSIQVNSKIKKKKGPLVVELERNPDIIAEIGKKKGNCIVVGFAMETENLLDNAKAKLKNKNMDLIVANELSEAGAGFQHDTNIIKILGCDGSIESLPIMEKHAAADRILDRVKQIREGGNG